MSQQTIISKVASHKNLQQHFTTMTCWHFISTYFLRASFAVIFLVLTSSLQCWSSVVKQTVLCTLSSLWALVRGKKSAALERICSGTSASTSAGNRLAPNFLNVKYKMCTCYTSALGLVYGLCVTSVLLIYSAEPSLILRETRPPT